jgi:hypothetical protein
MIIFNMVFFMVFYFFTYIDLSTIGGHVTAALFCSTLPEGIFVEYEHRHYILERVICLPAMPGRTMFYG